MRTQAFKIKSIEYEEKATFWWNNEEIIDYLVSIDSYNDEHLICLSIEQLYEMVAITNDEDIKKNILADIAWATENNQDLVKYLNL